MPGLFGLLIAALLFATLGAAAGADDGAPPELAATQATASVLITQPAPGMAVASPVTVRGMDLQPESEAVTVRLVVIGSGAVLATTTTPVLYSSSPGAPGSFAAALIFDPPAEQTSARVEVLPPEPDGEEPLATADVIVRGPLPPGPQVVITTPVAGAALGLSPVLVSGLETGGYDGPLTVQLVANPDAAPLGAANTQAQRPAPGQTGSWQVNLAFVRPQRTVGAQVQVLAVPPGGSQPQLYASVDVSVPGVLDGGGQVTITEPAPNAAVFSPLGVRGVASGLAVDATLVVRLRIQSTGADPHLGRRGDPAGRSGTAGALLGQPGLHRARR